MKLFLDTNVLFSALMSESGAAFELFRLAAKGTIELVTSDQCLIELKRIEEKMKFKMPFQDFLKTHSLSIVTLKLKDSDRYQPYVFDTNDAHVAQGADQSKAEFLVTFNTKDFKRDLLFQDFQLRVLTQGYFLQWLRGVGKYE